MEARKHQSRRRMEGRIDFQGGWRDGSIVREDAGKETSHETAWLRGVHERARRKVNGQGSPEAVLGHALGGSVRMKKKKKNKRNAHAYPTRGSPDTHGASRAAHPTLEGRSVT